MSSNMLIASSGKLSLFNLKKKEIIKVINTKSDAHNYFYSLSFFKESRRPLLFIYSEEYQKFFNRFSFEVN